MKQRTIDPLAPLLPVVRLAAVGLVAAAGTLAAVHLGPSGTTQASISAHDTGTTSTTTSPTGSGTNAQVAAKEANALLGEVEFPPGSVQLTSQPSGAPDGGVPPILPRVSTMVTRTAWWTSTLSPTDALNWMQAHPANGLDASISETSNSGPPVIGFQRNASGVLAEDTVYAEAFELPGGKTGIQLSSVVVYQPDRPAQETIPAAAKLVATPEFPLGRARGNTSATFTDQAEIDRVARIINALPTATQGSYSCPDDTGGGLTLDFESSGGTITAKVTMQATGCGGTSIEAAGTQQPGLASGYETIQQIQNALGTHWQLRPQLPR